MFFDRCKAITTQGKRCKGRRRKGSDYCNSHRNYVPKRFDFFKRYLRTLTFSSIFAVAVFILNLLFNPTTKDIKQEHKITRDIIDSVKHSIIDSMQNIIKSSDEELFQRIKKLSVLPMNNKIDDIDTYAKSKVPDYKRMVSILLINSKKLQEGFPNGYALFSSDTLGNILPLSKKPDLKWFDIDWSSMRIVITKDKFNLTFPDLLSKNRQVIMSNNSYGDKREDNLYRDYLFNANGVSPILYLIKNYKNQVIFLISFNIDENSSFYLK